MSLQPLLDASWSVKAHVALVLFALAIGTWLVFFSRKGRVLHRRLGVLFLGLIVAGSVLALLIPGRMPIPGLGLGPIHLIVPFALYAVWRAYDGARRGDVPRHRRWINILYFGLLVLVFAMNALVFPGITQQVFFGDQAIGGTSITLTIFSMGNRAALTGWLALVIALFASRSREMLFTYSGIVLPALLGATYAMLVTQVLITGVPEGADYSSLPGIRATLSTDAGTAAGWHHFLAFDLFVGTWIARDGLKHSVSLFVLLPILGLTFLFGPAGLLAYLIVWGVLKQIRAWRSRTRVKPIVA